MTKSSSCCFLVFTFSSLEHCQDSKKKDRKVHKVHDRIKDQGKKKVTKSA